MASAYHIIRRSFQVTVPRRLRARLWRSKSPLVGVLRRAKCALERGASHDELYDRHYYSRDEDDRRHTFAVIGDAIIEEFGPKSVLDVGCGSGILLERFAQKGVAVIGLEYSADALKMCRERGIEVHPFDLEADRHIEHHADVVVSTEVAEHLPSAVADSFVELLCSIGPTIVMTAAPPGQGGTDHVNEQPNEYWIKKFCERGYSFDSALTSKWRAAWHGAKVNIHYASNIMVFKVRNSQ